MSKQISSFLRNLKNAHLSSVCKNSQITVVCGNESADLDSVVSVLTYSYLNHLNDPSSRMLPLVNISRNDLELRRDVCYVLESSCISHDLLYYKEDLKHWKEDMGCDINAVLVDHNDLTLDSAGYVERVIGIIDHHQDLGLHISSIDLYSGPRIVEVAGSCTSLIFNYWSIMLKKKGLQVPQDAVALLVTSLLIDTDNMQHKVEKIDEEVFAEYKTILNDKMDFDMEYRKIREAKDDIAGLSLKDIFRKDYKEFVFRCDYRCGIASMVKSLQWLEQKFSEKEFQDVCQNFTSERELDLFILMCSFSENDNFSKQILFLETSSARSPTLIELINHLDEKLELNPLNVYENTNAKSFIQRNVKVSRKQVAPFLKGFLNS